MTWSGSLAPWPLALAPRLVNNDYSVSEIMASSPITSWQIDGETMETVTDYFGGAPKSLQMVTAAMKLKDACSLEGKL